MQSQSTSAIQTFRPKSIEGKELITMLPSSYLDSLPLKLVKPGLRISDYSLILWLQNRIPIFYKHVNAISNKIYFQVQVSLPITFSGVYMIIYKSYNVYVITFVLQSISDIIKAYWWTFWNYSYCKAAKYMAYIWQKPCLIRLGICPSNYNFF